MTVTPPQTDFSPELFEEFFYRTDSAALIIDTEFVIRDGNQAAVEFLGYRDRAHLAGSPVDEILVNDDILGEVARQLGSDDEWVGQAEIQTHDGRVYYGMGSAVPIPTGDDEEVIVGLFSDLMEQRRYAQSVKIMNRVLRHNLRNELTVLLGHLEHVRRQIDDEHEHHVDAIFEMLEELNDRADRARQLEQLIRGTDTDSLYPLRLDAQLEGAITAAEREHGDLVVDRPGEFPAVMVTADQTVADAFVEVFDNAVTHSDTDRPRVTVSMDVENGSAVVTITDDGPGIDPAREAQIFGRAEGDELDHGNGFGLFFVDQLMKLYGGKIWLVGDGADGTTFKLRFPRTY